MMGNFTLITFADKNNEQHVGLVVGDRAVNIAVAIPWHESLTGKKAGFSPISMLSILEKWDAALPALSAVADDILDRNIPKDMIQPFETINLLPPILYPKAIFCVGANYRDHFKEMTGGVIDKTKVRPYFFLKSPTHAVIGPGDAIRLPNHSSQIDWEAELAVVIGRPARHVNIDDALFYVAGYTILNDLSARDLVRRSDWPNWGADLLSAKTFDTSAPMGPWIVPAAQIPDPHDLSIELWVNDKRMQNSNTNHMIFSIAELIVHVSRQLTLQPGDVISTGTPAGVGKARGIFLKHGDRVKIRIERIGMLENPVVQS
jgi:2-keto-4-pentenoate hydratase/2-oxohepta-3-ene-1,7-dioic acid hydratase in catechol pathway